MYFFFHRDSFISNDMHYTWQKRFDTFRGYQNISELKLSENIADYFNGVVLQRLSGASNSHDGKMRFQLAFGVSIVWILIFILLCRGIRSLGQIAIGIAAFSFFGLSAVCIKLLTLLSFETIQDIFPATDWQEFFANSNSWSVAAQEVFFTWGLLGEKSNGTESKQKHFFFSLIHFLIQVCQFTRCTVKPVKIKD
jgi:solute carrier family 6 (neurotransmitter transporter), invertebrate